VDMTQHSVGEKATVGSLVHDQFLDIAKLWMSRILQQLQ